MRLSRFNEEQIIAILREQEAGAATADVCRKHGISSATFYKWKARYGGLEVSDARRLKVLRGRERKAEEASRRSHARQRHAEGRRGKKMVTPVARREAVAHLQRTHEVSQRRACQNDRGGSRLEFATAAGGLTIVRSAPGCGSWLPAAGGSVTGAYIFCSVGKAPS